MPETIKPKDSAVTDLEILEIYANDCEKVKYLADEYLHEELSEEEKEFIEAHIKECAECTEFIADERTYLEKIKLAEYVTEFSTAQSVMEKIIENQLTVDKPQRRRFVPFGLISAAVAVIIFAIAGGPLGLFAKNMNDSYDVGGESSTLDGGGDSNNAAYGVITKSGENDSDGYASSDVAAENIADDIAYENDYDSDDDSGVFSTGSVEPDSEDSEDSDSDTNIEISGAVDFINISYDDVLSLNSDIAVSEIYRINYDYFFYDIFENIEIYRSGDDGNYFIIAKTAKNTLDGNLSQNNIAASEIISGIPSVNSTQNAVEYIAVIFYTDYTG